MAEGNDELLVRRLAMDILLETYKSGEFGNSILKKTLDKYDYLDGKKKAFIKKLTAGCLERKIQLDYIIDLYSKTKTSKMKPVILVLLEMGVYQILFMDQVYDTLACNTTVSLAKKKGFSTLSGFVNALLRQVCRNKENIPYPDRNESFLEYLSAVFSVPMWITGMITKQYGEAVAEEILKGFHSQPLLSLRLKESMTDKEREALISKWKKDGVQVKMSPYLPYAVEVKGTNRISTLEGYEEGLFSIQDVSSMLVCECAGIKEGDCVVDVCAAPGGKSLHAAEKLKGSGSVLSFDLTEKKVARMIENGKRMKADNLIAKVGDATFYREELKEKADVLLADLPCSGIGVAARKQDILLNLSREKLDSIIALQREILTNVCRYLKKDGVFVYSTCTLNKEENDGNVAFIKENLPLKQISLKGRVPECFEPYLQEDGSLQLYRGELSCDGFFIAMFQKEN